MFVRIFNTPRDYAWGSRGQISALFGRESQATEAELWLGAHPGCPSRTEDGRTLSQVLDAAGLRHPPFLLKVLAAGSPLSLQVHPNTAQAQEGFSREDAAGIPLDAPNRSYRDRFAKPEIIVAVTQFEALSGLRPLEEARRLAGAAYGADARAEPLQRLLESSLEGAITWLLSGDPAVAEVVDAVTGALSSIADENPAAADTVRRLSMHYPGDPGIVVGMLLNRVTLAPDEALFLPAGNMHAYLEGVGIELMGPSDNVLRAGLTSKHVDADELTRVADFTPLTDPRMPRDLLSGALGYTPDAPFALRRISGEHSVHEVGEGVILAQEPTEVVTPDGVERLESGEAAYLDTLVGVSVVSEAAWLALAGDTPHREFNTMNL